MQREIFLGRTVMHYSHRTADASALLFHSRTEKEVYFEHFEHFDNGDLAMNRKELCFVFSI